MQRKGTFLNRFIEHKHVSSKMCQYIKTEEFDTESVMEDVLSETKGQSNIFVADDSSLSAINVVKAFVKSIKRYRNVSNKSFSTGIPFKYWLYYRKQAELHPKKLVDARYHCSDLVVSPHYGSLKEELLQSNLVDAGPFKDSIIEKGGRFIQSHRCRRMKSDRDEYNFGIPNRSPLSVRHVQAVIAYCDFTEFCSAFSSSFRRRAPSEDIMSVNKRNSSFYFVSKYLREAVLCYGCKGWDGAPNGNEPGPFWSGISYVSHIPEFAIALQGPTSTSKERVVAWRFAGMDGMVIRLNNVKEPGCDEAFLDVSWISCHLEENERIFFGFGKSLELGTIIVVETHKNYSKIMRALYKFDQVLCGNAMKDTVSSKEVDIIDDCMKHILEPEATQLQNDQFVLDTFYAWTLKKTRISLSLYSMQHYIANQNFVGLLMHPISSNLNDGIRNKNMFKPRLLALFPDLCEIKISAGIYNVDADALLSILVQMPSDSLLKTVVIEGRGEWLKNAFGYEIRQMFAKQNIQAEMDGQKKVVLSL